MRLLFLSDLHICDESDANAKNFIHFLENIVTSEDSLVLGGDIFDLFVSSKSHFLYKFQKIISALERRAQNGTKIYYLEGNHDFLMRDLFKSRANFFHDEAQFELDLAGKRFFISHGDLVNTKDYGYLFLRFLLRSFLVRVLIVLVPGSWIGKIGQKSSDVSRKYTSIESTAYAAKVRELFRRYAEEKFTVGNDFVLMGHTHIYDDHKVNGKQYLNLGFSSDSLRYAVFEPGDNYLKVKEYPAH